MITSLYCCKEYKVDSDGFIISKRDHKPMKPSVSPHGYLTTTVMINGKRKTMPIHSAIAKSFLDDKTVDGLVINHKDGNKQNNHLDNLEWVTPSENTRHSIDILGNGIEDKNGNARGICGVDIDTHKVKYKFSSLIGGAKFFANGKNPRYIQNVLWKALNNMRKTYRKCMWFYEDECEYEIDNIINIPSQYKIERGVRKLSDSDVRWIRTNYIPKDNQLGIRGMSRIFNVDRAVISAIIHYKT